MKRLFFALETVAPWPEKWPEGRLLDVSQRHATLAFLGNTDWDHLKAILQTAPQPYFPAGLSGILDHILLLPKRHPHVASCYVDFLDEQVAVVDYQKSLVQWLKSVGIQLDRHQEWLPHVTLAREPFVPKEWTSSFVPIPAVFKAIHLYESIGNLQYRPLWGVPIPLPWIEIDHTADLAFHVAGRSITQIYQHARLALAWQFPPLLRYQSETTLSTLDDVIEILNEEVGRADQEVGCPYKAISLHGDLVEDDNRFTWEMVVDV